MRSSNSDLQWVLFGGLVVVGLAVMGLVGISRVTGFTFWEVAENARALLIGPVLFAVVWLIEKFEIPLPIRIENTWPIILGALWFGIHTLLVMKAQQDGIADILGYVDYPEDWVDLPWYASSACLWIGFAGLVILGYVVRIKRNRGYW